MVDKAGDNFWRTTLKSRSVCVYVCVRERVCVCMYVCERERERECVVTLAPKITAAKVAGLPFQA